MTAPVIGEAGRASKEEYERGEGAIVRFVNYEGWERWIAVKRPFPLVVNVPDTPRLFPRFANSDPRSAQVHTRLFRLETWRSLSGGDEPIYLEDNASFDEQILTHRDRPSLHRERLAGRRHRELLEDLKRVLADADRSAVPLAEAIMAMHAVHELRRIVRLHDSSPTGSEEKP